MKKNAALKQLGTMDVAAYGISKTHGFLPEPDPLTTLPQEHELFRRMDRIRLNTPRYLGTERFRSIVDNFSDYFLHHVARGDPGEWHDIEAHLRTNERLARLARLALGAMMQPYVLGSPHEARTGTVCARIPAGLARLMVFVSELLDVPPIIAYQDYSLANWERLDPHEPIVLGNLMLLQYLLGGLDEAWFILVHVDIEARMGAVPDAALFGMRGVATGNADMVATGLAIMKNGFDRMYESFLRMREHCSSDIFFERVRPYIMGQKMNPALPNGVIYEGVSEKPFFLRGESGAQSSIIPLCAAALRVIYPDDEMSRYSREMHAYMPQGHRRFIADVRKAEKNFSIRQFVLEHKITHPFLFDLFALCLEGGKKFLTEHASFTEEYIHRHTAKSTAANPHNIGTGGSDFMQTLLRHANCWSMEADDVVLGLA